MSDADPISWQQTATGLQFLPASDPLWRTTPTPLVATYDVLGVPLRIECNAPLLAELAAASFGRWGTPADRDAALQLTLILHEGPDTSAHEARPAPVFRVLDDYFVLSVGASLGFADRSAGKAGAFIAPALLDDPAYVQVNFIECLGLYLTTRRRRAVLHAAALVHEGRCLLLTGHNGAGKSTLAYACVRAGFGLLAEDVVYIDEQANPPHAWGNPWQLHLLPDAARFFPELTGLAATEQLNGEHKVRVDIAGLRSDAAVTHADVAGVLSLGRSAGPVSRMRPADPAYVAACLTGFDRQLGPDSAVVSAEATGRLLAGPVAHLEAGSDLKQAAVMVREWLNRL